MKIKQKHIIFVLVGSYIAYEVLKNKPGIGKFTKRTLIPNLVYNTEEIKPGGRLERYWKPIEIDAKKYLGRDEEKRDLFYYDPDEAIKRFDLFGIEFGNWMNQEDRMNFLYASTVTFTDIAKVLKVSFSKIGLNRKLALSLGARGNGGRAAAHYEPGQIVINLTKTGGKGSLIYEWCHAIDHYIMYEICQKSGYASGSSFDCEESSLLQDIIDQVLFNDDGSPTSYKKWLKTASSYYNDRAEIWARICERFFHTQFKESGISNAWGVDRYPGTDWPDKRLVDNVEGLIFRLFRKVLS